MGKFLSFVGWVGAFATLCALIRADWFGVLACGGASLMLFFWANEIKCGTVLGGRK